MEKSQIIINHTRKYVYWLGDYGFRDVDTAIKAIDIESGMFIVDPSDKLELHDIQNLNVSYVRRLFDKGYTCNMELPIFFYTESDSDDDLY